MSHAKLSPSGAHRWMVCPGSVAAEEPYPDTSSEFAEWGTRAHELAEICLRNGFDPMDLPEDGDWDRYDQEMRATVRDYVDYVLSFGGEG